MRVAITGATGMIGRRLCQHYLAQGFQIHALSRHVQPDTDGLRWFPLDLATCKQDELVNFLSGCEILFHCAAELKHHERMVAVNLEGTRKLFAAALEAGTRRLVQLSSVGVYGPVRAGTIREDRKLNPQNDYEASKASADEWLLRQVQNYPVELVLLRPSNVFGSDMSNQSLAALVRAILNKKFFFIGDRLAVMNYIHADEVARAAVLCAEHPRAAGQTFIVSAHIMLAEFAAIVTHGAHPRWIPVIPEWLARLAATGLQWVPSFPLTGSRIDALTSHAIYSQEKIERELGFSAQISLRQYLSDYVSFVGSARR